MATRTEREKAESFLLFRAGTSDHPVAVLLLVCDVKRNHKIWVSCTYRLVFLVINRSLSTYMHKVGLSPRCVENLFTFRNGTALQIYDRQNGPTLTMLVPVCEVK